MDNSKIQSLEKRGWKTGSAEEFLGLTQEEVEYIELKLMLSDYLRKNRLEKKLTQIQLAKLIKSSQSRVAKMEHGDPTVSLDLIIRSILAMGNSKRDLADAIS